MSQTAGVASYGEVWRMKNVSICGAGGRHKIANLLRLSIYKQLTVYIPFDKILIMVERYTPPKIGSIWTEEEKFGRFLEIELLLCEALEKYKKIPKGTSSAIRKRASICVEKIKEIEESTHHDIIAFLKNLSESLGEYAQYLHWGMTSSDLLDTTLAWQIKDATKVILEDFSKEVGNIRVVICRKCGTVWVGTGEFNRVNFFYTKMKVDLNYMRSKYPEEYGDEHIDAGQITCDNIKVGEINL